MGNTAHTIAALRGALGRLAEYESDGTPVVSAYLDLRPETTQDPRVRTGQIVLRDTLRGALNSYEAHTPEHESLAADAERIERHVTDDLLPAARGALVFACSGRGLFESLATLQPLEDAVVVDPRPHLVGLARLADREPALVALADTNTLRLFALRSGGLVELGEVDEDPAYKRTQAGGWSQARYQRHVDEHREEFAELAAQAIEENMAAEDATVLVLAGDEVALPRLRGALSKRAADAVKHQVRADMRSSLEDISEICLPVLDEIRADERRERADRLVGATDSEGMGVTGPDDVRAALELGQVMELVVAEEVAADEVDMIEELVRAAVTTGAAVSFIEGHDALRERGGVGALLRFRLDRDIDELPEQAANGDRAHPVGATADTSRR